MSAVRTRRPGLAALRLDHDSDRDTLTDRREVRRGTDHTSDRSG